jgi:hypothetical protein
VNCRRDELDMLEKLTVSQGPYTFGPFTASGKLFFLFFPKFNNATFRGDAELFDLTVDFYMYSFFTISCSGMLFT